ncbi:sulfate transporter 3,4 [Artemisia annua]|uniref:Sulfate transporter 3,4 n=1 Tax=Artemisia annua TaxID=35608 RepID=A0A2U1MU33_ARTAN|nr:sulfate transporter 3,4 [Artemisia annua]
MYILAAKPLGDGFPLPPTVTHPKHLKHPKMSLNTNRVENHSGSGHVPPQSTTISIRSEPHEVSRPPAKTTFQKLRHKLSEVFFPDDPLHRFKNQTCANKIMLALRFVLPIFEWGRSYSFGLFRSDAVAGLTIASLAIPQVRFLIDFLSRLPCWFLAGAAVIVLVAATKRQLGSILRWLREEEDWVAADNGSMLKCVIIDMSAVTAIDTSGLAMVNELRTMLDKRSLQLVLANPTGSVMEKLHQSNTLDSFGSHGLYLTVSEAVADISSSWKGQP